MKKQILLITLLLFSLFSFAQIKHVTLNRNGHNSGANFNKSNHLSYFLKVDGVDGTSTDSSHRNWIPISGFEYMIQLNRTNSGQATGGVKTILSIYKSLDGSSVELVSYAHKNLHFPKVTIDVTQRIDGKMKTILRYEIINTAIASYNLQTHTESQEPIEDITLIYQSIEMTYYLYDKSGNLISQKDREINLHSNY